MLKNNSLLNFFGRNFIMLNMKPFCNISLIYLLLLLGLAFAQESESPLVVSLESFIVEEVVLEDGSVEEQFTSAEFADPSNVIEYRVHLLNQGDTTLEGVQAVGPVPEDTFYLDNSATTSEEAWLEFSVDSGQTFGAAPIVVTITNEVGEEEEVVVPPEQYTTARWTLLVPLEAKQSKSFSYRVEVR